MNHPDLSDSRAAIERLDRDLIRLLAERMDVVQRIAATKADATAVPLRDDQREAELFEAWSRIGAEQGLSPYFLGRVLREVLSWSRRAQEPVIAKGPAQARVRVGYQGAPSAYSDLAARKLFSLRAQAASTRGYHSFEEAVDALERGAIEYALLPIENSIHGSIDAVYRLLGERPVHIVDEEVWDVEHCLAAPAGASIDGLEVVHSHGVALAQCERFLRSLDGVRAETSYDTAAAAVEVAESGDVRAAALCSEEAALASGLTILARKVADAATNTTRFVLLASRPEPLDARVPARTSLVIKLDHRRGALAELLSEFSQAGCSLSKLESRPQIDRPWEYVFYVDVEGHAEHEPLASALHMACEHSNSLRVLGSYPRRTGPELEALPGTPPPAEPAAPPRTEEPPPAGRPKRPARSVDLAASGRRTRFRVGSVEIGPETFTLILGPCAVESRAQVQETAEMVKAAGARVLRGGAFKPRTSPYSFQGLGHEGVALLAEAGAAFEMPVVTEVLRIEDAARIAERADMLQVGARNMQNFALLSELGRLGKPVLLKRGMSATVEELLSAAEYILAAGNRQVALCERGIRTFETATRNTLDLSAVPVLKSRTHLPVFVDPSHAAGRRDLVVPLAVAAAAIGADGLIIEAHPRPEEARCDGEQALRVEELNALRNGLRPILAARGLALPGEG